VALADTRLRAPARLAELRAAMACERVSASIVLSPASQTYLVGFRALLYSRPIVLIVAPDSTLLVIPGLEETHAREEAAVDELLVYHEHPGGGAARDHLECLERTLAAVAPRQAIGVELSVCSAGLARRLTRAGHRLADLDPTLSRMRAIKDDTELALIREAAWVTGIGVGASLDACHPGRSEIEIDGGGTTAVMAAVARLGGDTTVEQLIMTPSGRERSILPHALSTTRRLGTRDLLIHTRQVGLGGYRAELERTAFVGRPDDEQARAFRVVRSAQQAAIDAVRTGARCRDIDAAARRVIDRAGLGRFAIHRTGHGIGLATHEPPYLRYDNDSPLADGMVITIEPGIYIPGVGGFRHSDTVVVRGDGHDRLTEHPTDLDTLTFDAAVG
jgi:Xaa-Pro dipeptidase